MQVLPCVAMLLIITGNSLANQSRDEEDFDAAPLLIKNHGYPVESHSVLTADGYVLTMHRIPYSPKTVTKPLNKDAIHTDSKDIPPEVHNNVHKENDFYTSSEIEDILRYKNQYVNNYIEDGTDIHHYQSPMKGLPVQNYFNPNGYEDVKGMAEKDIFEKRIPKESKVTKSVFNSADKQAVLLQHGVLASSLDWILTGPEKALVVPFWSVVSKNTIKVRNKGSLQAPVTVNDILKLHDTVQITNGSKAYKLVDAGHDVWLGNLRGTFPSRHHSNYTTKQPEYWDYSWHEIGLYDLSAMIDHVLKTTGQRDLHFIGHSMGATIAVVLLSEKPEYNEKVKIAIFLAPVVRLRHNTSVFRHSSPMWKALQKVTKYSGMHDFPPDPKSLHRNLEPMCREKYIGQGICASILHTVAGYARNINTTLLPTLFGHYPTQTSVKTLSHFLQGMNTGNFTKYDYDEEQNVIKYNRTRPPHYNISKITSPTVIFYGDSDPFTDSKDISWLEGKLPNLIKSLLVSSESFSHLSFLWDVDVDTVLYDPILRLIARNRKKE